MIHIDQGSAEDILYFSYFSQLGISFKSLQPTTLPLTGFTTELVRPLGTIALAVTVGVPPQEKTLISTFYVIDAPSPFNIILGRPWINGAKAVPSTYHLCVKFPTPHGIATVRGNQIVAKECMRVAIKTSAQGTASNPFGGVHSVLMPISASSKTSQSVSSETSHTHTQDTSTAIPTVSPQNTALGSYPDITDATESVVLDPFCFQTKLYKLVLRFPH